MSRPDLAGEILARLHANSRLTREQLASSLGVPLRVVEEVVAGLLDAGHLERQGARLVPDAASHPTPGLFVANEREDARAVEEPYSRDEDAEE